MGVFIGIVLLCLLLLLVPSLRHAMAQFPQNPIPIGTVIVAEQQLVITTQMPINPASELVDQVESIDVSSTQMIITTTRQGPPDTARVAISIADTVTGEELPPMNLTGILLVLTRGRYTVNWLQPNRWYGVNFRAEQHYAGGSAVYTNEEAHLVKTRRVDGSHDEGNSVVSLRAERYGEKGRSLENLVLTMRWEQHPDERPNLDALANITLFCNDQIKYKQLHLRGREIDKSVEIRLENEFEVTEQRNGTVRKMIASIKPKNCIRICWSAELIAETRKQTFRRSASNHCEQIEPISANTQLREYAGYEIAPNGDLIVKTNFSGSEEKSEESDAYVQLTAIEIPESQMADNGTVRFKTFNTKKEGEQYVLNNMEPGKLYAVQYTYGKQSPFAYEESHRFLLDMASGMQPMHMHFNLTEPYGPRPGVIATAKLDPMFKQYEVGIDVEPLCELNESTIHFWLTKDRPEKELHEPPLLDSLCSAVPRHSVCSVHHGGDGWHSCGMTDGKLCYTLNMVVHGKIFSAPRECATLADHVPPLPSTTTTTTTTTSTTSTTKSTSATHTKSSPNGTTPTAQQNAKGMVGHTEVPSNATSTENASVGPQIGHYLEVISTIFLILFII